MRAATKVRLGVESLEARDVPSGGRWSPPATSQISGMIYRDENFDGHAQDWEWRVQGVGVFLSGQDTAGNLIRRQTTTDQGGIYWFRDLPAGGYSIRINPPDSYGPGGHDVGDFGGTPNGATIELLTVPAGQTSGAYNFALLRGPAPGTPIPSPVKPPPVANSQVSGLVYADENRDGRAQDWEWRFNNVTVTLTGTDTAGTPVSRTSTTDQGGIYWFRALPPGTYQIRVTTPEGYTSGQSSVGAFGGNPQPNLVTRILIPIGQTSGAYNFGQLRSTRPDCPPPPPPPCPPPSPPPAQTSSLGGLVFVDVDLDDTFSDGDIRLSAVPVTIAGTTTAGQSVSRSTTTTADGTYNFAALAAGTYAVSVEQPSEYIPGDSFAGAFGGALGLNTVTAIAVPAGQTSNGYDFSFEIEIPN